MSYSITIFSYNFQKSFNFIGTGFFNEQWAFNCTATNLKNQFEMHGDYELNKKSILTLSSSKANMRI